ncbi:phosphatidate cytidylyltransferase [Candidatus Pelagibacter bacterium nBUS_33]|jgi:phosphatidate cytidylyltransferase|uniref:phosphatidate cytidylyltransferase n=1 Tax=Candidatus Pelagibacter bacterium nBUS_33 TaxID=3374193 RepID=UPI003EBD3CF4
MSKELLNRFLSSLVLIPVIIFVVIQGGIIFNLFLLISFFLTVFEWHKMSKMNNHYILGIFFLLFSFFSIYYLRNYLNEDYLFFLFILLICVSTDVGGYVAGKIIKGPKLSKISPKKTYSGMLGSFLFPVIFSYFFLNYVSFNNSTNMSAEILIFIICISGISQLGDLVVSYFKRASNVKDSGKLIPGHGGILDRIDGMIFAFPLSLIILLTKNINIF